MLSFRIENNVLLAFWGWFPVFIQYRSMPSTPLIYIEFNTEIYEITSFLKISISYFLPKTLALLSLVLSGVKTYRSR